MMVVSMMKYHSKMKDFIVFLPAKRDLRDHYLQETSSNTNSVSTSAFLAN